MSSTRIIPKEKDLSKVPLTQTGTTCSEFQRLFFRNFKKIWKGWDEKGYLIPLEIDRFSKEHKLCQRLLLGPDKEDFEKTLKHSEGFLHLII
jgi:hypothetical protein